MNPAQTPGSLTVVADPSPMTDALLAANGHEWKLFQVTNGDNDPMDFDLAPTEQAGLVPGTWGVTYGVNNQADKAVFLRDGERLARQTLRVGGKILMVDAEDCAKFTRDGHLLTHYVDGVRKGGWTGPVHLTTMGAPDNPRTKEKPQGNDYEVDVETILETGGGIFSQDYFNESDSFSPELGYDYWTAVGVPVDRYNSMIGSHISASDKRKPNLRLTGEEWRHLLEVAGVRRNHSIFMAEFTTVADLIALAPLALKPQPPSVTLPEQIRQQMLDLGAHMVHIWRVEQNHSWTRIKKTRIYKALNQLDPKRFPMG